MSQMPASQGVCISNSLLKNVISAPDLIVYPCLVKFKAKYFYNFIFFPVASLAFVARFVGIVFPRQLHLLSNSFLHFYIVKNTEE